MYSTLPIHNGMETNADGRSFLFPFQGEKAANIDPAWTERRAQNRAVAARWSNKSTATAATESNRPSKERNGGSEDDDDDDPVEALDLRLSRMDESILGGTDDVLSVPHESRRSAAGPWRDRIEEGSKSRAEPYTIKATNGRREEQATYGIHSGMLRRQDSLANEDNGLSQQHQLQQQQQQNNRDSSGNNRRSPTSPLSPSLSRWGESGGGGGGGGVASAGGSGYPQYLAEHLPSPDPRLPNAFPASPTSPKSSSSSSPMAAARLMTFPHSSSTTIAHPTSPPPTPSASSPLPQSSSSPKSPPPLPPNPRHSLFRSSLQTGASKPRSYWRSQYSSASPDAAGGAIKKEPILSPPSAPPPATPLPPQDSSSPRRLSYLGLCLGEEEDGEHVVLQSPPSSHSSIRRSLSPSQSPAGNNGLYLDRRSCSPEIQNYRHQQQQHHQQQRQQQQQPQEQQQPNVYLQQQQYNKQQVFHRQMLKTPAQQGEHLLERTIAAVYGNGRTAGMQQQPGGGGGRGGGGGGNYLRQVLRRTSEPPQTYAQRQYEQQLWRQRQQLALDRHFRTMQERAKLPGGWAGRTAAAAAAAASPPSRSPPPPLQLPLPPEARPTSPWSNDQPGSSPGEAGRGGGGSSSGKGRRGRPRKHALKIPLPPLYVFIRNLLHSRAYNPRVISWVSESQGVFKVVDTQEFARTWGLMKSNRSEEMNYEKMSRAMRYHYGNERQGRKGHLAMVREKRLVYRFGELAVRWRRGEVRQAPCDLHQLCKGCLCLWTKE